MYFSTNIEIYLWKGNIWLTWAHVSNTHLQVKQNAGVHTLFFFLYREKEKKFSEQIKKKKSQFQPHILYTHHIIALCESKRVKTFDHCIIPPLNIPEPQKISKCLPSWRQPITCRVLSFFLVTHLLIAAQFLSKLTSKKLHQPNIFFHQIKHVQCTRRERKGLHDSTF